MRPQEKASLINICKSEEYEANWKKVRSWSKIHLHHFDSQKVKNKLGGEIKKPAILLLPTAAFLHWN